MNKITINGQTFNVQGNNISVVGNSITGLQFKVN